MYICVGQEGHQSIKDLLGLFAKNHTTRCKKTRGGPLRAPLRLFLQRVLRLWAETRNKKMSIFFPCQLKQVGVHFERKWECVHEVVCRLFFGVCFSRFSSF